MSRDHTFTLTYLTHDPHTLNMITSKSNNEIFSSANIYPANIERREGFYYNEFSTSKNSHEKRIDRNNTPIRIQNISIKLQMDRRFITDWKSPRELV